MNSFINFLKRNKLYSAVNLLGLSLSMAFVLLLAVYVTSQLSTDSFQKNADGSTSSHRKRPFRPLTGCPAT